MQEACFSPEYLQNLYKYKKHVLVKIFLQNLYKYKKHIVVQKCLQNVNKYKKDVLVQNIYKMFTNTRSMF